MKNNLNLRFIEIFWFVLIFLLPITSLPLASKMLRSEMVAAPSIIILILIVAFLFLIKQFEVLNNKVFYPLIIFGLVAILSSLLSFFLPIPIQNNFQIEQNILEGLITLGIGILFFYVTITVTRNTDIRIKTLKIISLSFIPLSIWCFIQFIFGQIVGEYPPWMAFFQNWISTSGALYNNRLTGFAFEPSWLAHQMNMFYIPIFLGSSFTRQSAFRKFNKKIIIEDILLIFSIFILIFTKSRVGWITFIFIALYYLFRINNNLIRKLSNYNFLKNKKTFQKLIPILLFISYLFFIILGLFFFSKFDSRMENLFNLEFYKNRNLFSIANEFVFAERILYWQTGWQIFNDFPLFGVGLGNSGFFLNDYLPSFAWALDEPRHLIFQATYQGNIKNLWFRLLSETGMIGFLSFITWLMLIFLISKKFENSGKKHVKIWGFIGKIAIIALVFEGFSIDSFALPYYWIILGLVASNFKELPD